MKPLRVGLVFAALALLGACSAGSSGEAGEAAESALVPVTNAVRVAAAQFARYETRGSVGDDMLGDVEDALAVAVRAPVPACAEDHKGAAIKVIRAHHEHLRALRSGEKPRILAAEISLETLNTARAALILSC